MSLRKIVFMLFYYKWMLIIPVLIAPVASIAMLVFVEPVYMSSCKLWTKEHVESSKLLRVQRPGTQETTFVEVQREIILSDDVLMMVIDQCKLYNPPPSQSVFAKMTGYKQNAKPLSGDYDPKIEAMRALRSSTWVEIINPEIITAGVKMNSPKLAQRVLVSLLDAYRSEYLNIITNEITQYRKFLDEQISLMRTKSKEKEEQLIAFEEKHPEIRAEGAKSGYTVSSASIEFAKGVGDFSPVPEILKELARLEMLKIRALSRYDKSAPKITEIQTMITENQKLLKIHTNKLSDMAKLTVLHKSLQWELLEYRRHISQIETEYFQILISEGSKVKQVSNITILDKPSLEIRKIYPKKKVTVLASVFLGFIFGIGLIYLRIFMDGTYHLPEDIYEDTGLPVLQVISIEKKKN